MQTPPPTTPRRFFASDNSAGVHPRVWEALARANAGHALGYGDDLWTRAAVERFREHFGPQVEVFFVFGGTGANVVGLQALTDSYHAIICTECAHINTDECGAPERFLGCKLLAEPSPDGKVRPEAVARHLGALGVEHHSQPRVISLTQATEMGTVYTPDEIRALAECAHRHGLFVHMDGARLANAAAGLGVGLRDISGDVGVDVLSFGGTKNGLMYGEAVVCFRPELAQALLFVRKQAMQLASKMRFVAAQFEALLADDLWRENAAHANRMAGRLAQGMGRVPGVQITQAVQANAVFARIPRQWLGPLRERYPFYVWDEVACEVRWMASFDTSEEDVAGFVAAAQALAAHPEG